MKDMLFKGGSIEFITKFTRVFKKINSVDFGDNKLHDQDLTQFSEELKLNKYIKNVLIKNKKGVSKEMNRELERQIKYNKAIDEQFKAGKPIDSNTKGLQLTNLKDVSFLPKMIADFSSLEVLDLSDSDLRSKDSMNQLCKMID